MPVTEQNSTIKIAPFNEKILQKNSVSKKKKRKKFQRVVPYMAAWT